MEKEENRTAKAKRWKGKQSIKNRKQLFVHGPRSWKKLHEHTAGKILTESLPAPTAGTEWKSRMASDMEMWLRCRATPWKRRTKKSKGKPEKVRHRKKRNMPTTWWFPYRPELKNDITCRNHRKWSYLLRLQTRLDEFRWYSRRYGWYVEQSRGNEKKWQTQGGKRKQIKKRTMRQRQTQTGQQLRHFIVLKLSGVDYNEKWMYNNIPSYGCCVNNWPQTDPSLRIAIQRWSLPTNLFPVSSGRSRPQGGFMVDNDGGTIVVARKKKLLQMTPTHYLLWVDNAVDVVQVKKKGRMRKNEGEKTNHEREKLGMFGKNFMKKR